MRDTRVAGHQTFNSPTIEKYFWNRTVARHSTELHPSPTSELLTPFHRNKTISHYETLPSWVSNCRETRLPLFFVSNVESSDRQILRVPLTTEDNTVVAQNNRENHLSLGFRSFFHPVSLLKPRPTTYNRQYFSLFFFSFSILESHFSMVTVHYFCNLSAILWNRNVKGT